MIIHRAFYKDIWATFFAIMTILILIYMGHRFVRFLNEAASGGLAEHVIFSLLMLKTISSQVVLVPLSAFLATLITFGRMHQDNEITALISSGLSPWRILSMVSVFAFILAMLAGSIALKFGPEAEERGYQIQDQLSADIHAKKLLPAQFQSLGVDGGIIYAESSSADGNTLHQVFVQRERSNGILEIAYAKTAKRQMNAQGEEYFILEQGTHYNVRHGHREGQRIDFEEYAVLLQPLKFKERTRKRWAQPSQQLLDSGQTKDLAELQWRLSAGISTFLLPILAFFLSKTDNRSGRYAKLMTGVLIYLLYNNFLAASKAWVDSGALPTLIGLWWVHGVIVLLIIILAYRQGLFYRQPKALSTLPSR